MDGEKIIFGKNLEIVYWNFLIKTFIKILKYYLQVVKWTHASSTRLYTILYTGTLLLRFLRHFCVCIHPLFIRALWLLLCIYMMNRINCLKTNKTKKSTCGVPWPLHVGSRTSTCRVLGPCSTYYYDIHVPKIFQHRTICDETYKSTKPNPSLMTYITYFCVLCNTFVVYTAFYVYYVCELLFSSSWGTETRGVVIYYSEDIAIFVEVSIIIYRV